VAGGPLSDTGFASARLADVLARLCCPVPPSGSGVCAVCHGCPHPGFVTCWSCARVAGQLGWVCPLVVPVSLYLVHSPLHDCLRRYKDAARPDSRRRAAASAATLLGRFLVDHGDCLRSAAGTGWDYLTTVPSSTGRTGTHPLESAQAQVAWLPVHHRPTLVRGPGRLGHTTASVNGFSIARPVDGDRILVVDDTFTSGARAQSAAAALHRGGAQVVAIVRVGRVIDPSHGPHVSAWWAARAGEPFDLGRCCLDRADDPGPVLRPAPSMSEDRARALPEPRLSAAVGAGCRPAECGT